jgi:hypothetical protein
LKHFLIVFFIFCVAKSNAQFAPQAGLVGSTAIHKDSAVFVDWASNCTINRGWMNIADTTLGKTTSGTNLSALGIPDGDVVSLGDGGEVIYYFSNPIINGNGFDFAVFENGFRSPADSNLSYMELAFVEVSNDGVNYKRFAASCNMDSSMQTAGYGQYTDCRLVNGLAGKYIANYGTPFDLDEFLPLSSININDIHYIKIKDVVGSIHRNYCSYDAQQNVINDPYPTDFITGGFDLEALGIIHQLYPTSVSNEGKENVISVYPNPCQNQLQFQSTEKIKTVSVISIDGKIVLQFNEMNQNNLDVSSLKVGIYLLKIETEQGKIIHQYFTKN